MFFSNSFLWVNVIYASFYLKHNFKKYENQTLFWQFYVKYNLCDVNRIVYNTFIIILEWYYYYV